jgi:hypothetical protein
MASCFAWASMSKVPHLPVVEAWKVAGGKLLWWPNDCLLRRWCRSVVELLLMLLLLQLELPLLVLRAIAPILLLLRSAQLTPRWGIHYAVLRRSTARTITSRGSMHHPLPLLLLDLSNSLHCPFLINGGTCQFIVGQVGGLNHVVLQLDGKPFMEEVGFLLIRINMI